MNLPFAPQLEPAGPASSASFSPNRSSWLSRERVSGVLLAYQSLGFIVARLPKGSFPNEADFHIHVPVLLFSVGLALITGILFGLFPALQFARPEISQVMQSSTRKVAGSVRGKRLHSVLIAGQIALTLLLLTRRRSRYPGLRAHDARKSWLQPA